MRSTIIASVALLALVFAGSAVAQTSIGSQIQFQASANVTLSSDLEAKFAYRYVNFLDLSVPTIAVRERWLFRFFVFHVFLRSRFAIRFFVFLILDGMFAHILATCLLGFCCLYRDCDRLWRLLDDRRPHRQYVLFSRCKFHPFFSIRVDFPFIFVGVRPKFQFRRETTRHRAGALDVASESARKVDRRLPEHY